MYTLNYIFSCFLLLQVANYAYAHGDGNYGGQMSYTVDYKGESPSYNNYPTYQQETYTAPNYDYTKSTSYDYPPNPYPYNQQYQTYPTSSYSTSSYPTSSYPTSSYPTSSYQTPYYPTSSYQKPPYQAPSYPAPYKKPDYTPAVYTKPSYTQTQQYKTTCSTDYFKPTSYKYPEYQQYPTYQTYQDNNYVPSYSTRYHRQADDKDIEAKPEMKTHLHHEKSSHHAKLD